MREITELELKNEIGRLFNLVEKHSYSFLEKYSNLDENVKSYVYAKSRPMHRGYYNPTIAAHVAIGGNQKGSKPKKEPPSDGDEFVVYGLDEFDRPIYVQTMISQNRMAFEYEIVKYFDESIIGITFEKDKYKSIHESRFVNGKIESIITCSFGLMGNTDLHDCNRIEMEIYEYDRPNHFIWSFTWYNPNWRQFWTKEIASPLKLDLTKPLIQNMQYEFDTDDNGKLLRMYNNEEEKIFNNNQKKKARSISL